MLASGRAGAWEIKEVRSEAEARRVATFLVSRGSFDERLTPGEAELAQQHPIESLHQDKSQYWYVENELGEIIAVNGVKENEHKNNGYVGAFLAVAKNYRRQGIAQLLFELMLNFIRAKQGRYLLIDTSDREEYGTIRAFLEKRGFLQVGYFPNHYYDGEGTYWYYLRLDGKNI